MESQRYVNLACQQGLVSVEALKEAQHQQREEAKQGGNISVWEVLQARGVISPDKAKEIESSMDSTQQGQGLRVEGYVLKERIGSGGMGDVYLGIPENGKGEQVAIKMMPSRLCSDPEHLQRFVRETKALSELEDEHFTSFFSSGQIDNRPYLIMELVRGLSLKERLLQQGALRQHEAVALLVQLSGALIKAEDHHVVHRDIKPANILIAPAREGKDEPFCAKICDFGLVKFLQDRAESMGADGDLTMSGIALGTPHYMSPEQATGERQIDHRSDMYSLAASVYHTMMGRTLFSGKTSAVIMYKQVTAAIDVEPLRDRGCGDGLIHLLRDMLHKEPSERPESWRDVYARSLQISDDLPRAQEVVQGSQDDLLTDSGLDSSPSPVPGMPMGIFQSRRRALRGMAVFACLCVLLLAAISWMVWPPGIQQVVFQANPQNIQKVLTDIDAQRSASFVPVLVLEPGLYHKAVHLTPDHSGLEIRALEPGVTLQTGTVPAFDLQAGVTGVRVSGAIEIQSQAPSPLKLGAASELTLDGVRIAHRGRIRLVQAKLHLLNVDSSATFELTKAELTLNNTTLHDLQSPLILNDSVLIAKDVYVGSQLAMDGALLQLRTSSVRLQSARIENPRAHTALLTYHCSWLEMADVSISGRYRAWNSVETTAVSLRHVSLLADRLAMSWEGVRKSQWQWSDMEFLAAHPAQGLMIEAYTGSGARAAHLPARPE